MSAEDVIAWSGHGLGIEEPHEQITDLVVYPCEVWCVPSMSRTIMFIKYANQSPYRFEIRNEVFMGVPDTLELVWLWIDYNWRWAQQRIATVEKLART